MTNIIKEVKKIVLYNTSSQQHGQDEQPLPSMEDSHMLSKQTQEASLIVFLMISFLSQVIRLSKHYPLQCLLLYFSHLEIKYFQKVSIHTSPAGLR